MEYVDFISDLHNKAKRDYIERVVKYDKVKCVRIAKKLGRKYWDGEREYGYGGYQYDGRWKSVAEKLIEHYRLRSGHRVLDVGCGKAYLLYEIKKLIPGIEVSGIDLSKYALRCAKYDIKPFLQHGSACNLPYGDNYFDLVLSLNTLHFMEIYDLERAIKEIERVKRGSSYIVEESYRNEREKFNLLCWQLTCECIFSTEAWVWLYEKFGYTGDYSFIYFT